jgi:hypothetical protein
MKIFNTPMCRLPRDLKTRIPSRSRVCISFVRFQVLTAASMTMTIRPDDGSSKHF